MSRRPIADHDLVAGDLQCRVHHAVAVFGGYLHPVRIAEPHDHQRLCAERALVERDGLVGGAIEVQVWIESRNRHCFSLALVGCRLRGATVSGEPAGYDVTTLADACWALFR